MCALAVLTEVDIVKDHIRAYSQGDWEAWKRGVADDVTYEEPATGRMLRGIDAVLDGIKMWKEAFPDLVGTVTNVFGCENQVVAEITWEGTQTGPLMGPTGAIAPTGQRGTTSAAQLFIFEDDKVKAMRHYFDMMGILRQAGALPAS